MAAVDSYLAIRRAAGFELEVPEYLLRSFARYATERNDEYVRIETVTEWALQAPSLSQRDKRHKTVVRLARHLQIEDEQHEVPPMDVFGYRKTRRMPYIFSQADINSLLEAATQLGPTGSLRPHTYSTLFALLSVTGLRISEALGLSLDDVTPNGLVIRESKFHKSRLVPLHETAMVGLDQFIAHRKLVSADDDKVFISLRRRGLKRGGAHWTFRKLLETIGLDPQLGGRRPRIHDLRHTFAVRALEACPEGRDNVGRHLLALSTYMGHSNISDTFWYLQATPHLMRDIASVCEIYINGDKS